MLENILNKLSIKEIGKHLSNYANLYVKPIEAWKRAIDLRTSSYDFVILHIVYFTMLVLLIVRDIHIAIPICLIEIILTLFPFIIFILPYKVSFFLFKKTIDWRRLFRLILIIKLQAIPIFFLLFKFADYYGLEYLYLLIDNIVIVTWILYILVFPLISNLKYYQKLIWIFLNYISFAIIILLITIPFPQSDFSGKLSDEIMLKTPTGEYQNNFSKFSHTFMFFDETSYFLIGKESKPNMVIYESTIFADLRLSILFNKKVQNDIIKKQIYIDSILCILDKTRVSKKDSLQSKLQKKELNYKLLDSFRTILLKDVQNDLILTDSLSKHAKFKSNRDYYTKLNLYLDEYCRSYFNKYEIQKIHKKAINKTMVKLEDNTYITMLVIPKNNYFNTKKPYIEAKERINHRNKISNFLINVLLYPFEKILSF